MVDQGMLVDVDGMPEQHVRAENPDVLQPFDRRLAVTPNHLAELHHRLSRVGLHGDAAAVGGLFGQREQPLGTGVGLRRTDHAHEPARRMRRRRFDDIESAREVLDTFVLEPFVHVVATGRRVPAAGLDHRTQIGADAGRGQRGDPVVERSLAIAEQLGHRRTAAAQQAANRCLQRRQAGFGVAPHEEGVFEERCHPHVPGREVLEEPLGVNVTVAMGMGVDQPRHDEPPAAVDHPLRVATVAAADLNDGIAVKDHVTVQEVGIAVRGLVVADDPVGFPDDRSRAHSRGGRNQNFGRPGELAHRS